MAAIQMLAPQMMNMMKAPAAPTDMQTVSRPSGRSFVAEMRQAMRQAYHQETAKAPSGAKPESGNGNEIPLQGENLLDGAAMSLVQQMLAALAATPQMTPEQLQALTNQISEMAVQFQLAGGTLPPGFSAEQFVQSIQAELKRAGTAKPDTAGFAATMENRMSDGVKVPEPVNPAQLSDTNQKAPVQTDSKQAGMDVSRQTGMDIPRGFKPVDSRIQIEGADAVLDRPTPSAHTLTSHYQVQGEQLRAPAAKDAAPVVSVREIPEQIQKAVESGNRQIVLRLDPPDLGQVHVRLRMNQGVLTADLKVDSGSTKDVFTSALPQIRASLEHAGIRVGELQVDLHDDYVKDQSARHGQSDAQSQNQRRNQAPREQFFEYLA